jgi:hypothetical protein
MGVRQQRTAVAAVGACMLGLLGCGGSSRHATTRGVAGATSALETHSRLSVGHGPEFATRLAGQEAAFATFGEQASPTERAAIVSELRRYYGALVEARFERGCLLLSRNTRTKVAKRPGEDGDASEHSCGKRLAEVFAATVGERKEHSQFTVVSAKEVRLKGSGGYVVFTTVATPVEGQALSLVRESGRWEVTSPIAAPIMYVAPAALTP